MLRVADCVADCVWFGHTTADRMAEHRKSDQSRDDLCGDELRKGAWNTLCQWGRLGWIIDLDLLHDTTSEAWLFPVAD